jgi:isoprenylcysteine carboxyl methyltransferase (ICMT) family protein YpbQ
MNMIIILFFAAVALRLASLVKSTRNEKKLRKANAVEYGRKNSIWLTVAHILFYLSAITESLLFERRVNDITWLGVGIFIFSMIVLWAVIYSLKDIWTVKLFIAPYQVVNRSFIFKYFRHPNYFLNIIPELVALAMICQAWYTLMIGLPLYFIPLTIRIVQEEKVMKTHFSNY